jgi:ATP-dependent DNA ligase
MAAHTLIFYAFDLLHLNGKDLRFSLLEQRAELKKLIARDTKGWRLGCILPGMCEH